MFHKCYNYAVLSIFFVLYLALAACQPTADATPKRSAEYQQNQKLPTLTELWAFDTKGKVYATPLLYKDTAYVATQKGVLIALDLEKGTENWRYTPTEGVWGRSPVLAGDMIIIGQPGELLVSLDAETGQERWRATVTGNVQRPPRFEGNTLYVGTAFVGQDLPSEPEKKAWLYALEASTGEVIWSQETDNYAFTTPAIFEDTLYAAGSFYNPDKDVTEGGFMRIYALDTATGQTQWTSESQAGFVKSIHADADRVHYLGYQDTLFALNSKTGDKSWKASTENWTPSFVVSDNVLYFGSANAFVHALDPLTGDNLWKFNLNGTFNFPVESPQRVGDILYFQTIRREVYALDANDGSLLWTYRHDIPTREALVVTGNQFLVIGNDGTVNAFALPSK